MMLQTYVQLKDPFKSDEYGQSYYENYVSSIKYVAAEFGVVREEPRYYSEASCGTKVLGTVDGGTYKGVKGQKPECGFYLKNLGEMGVQNSNTQGVFFISAFSRKFEDHTIQKIRRGDKLVMRAGFNIFDSVIDLERTMWGYSNEFEVELSPLDDSGAL
eukprot:CAMPEP_0170463890 /NCGR_PEP_ID=MMETSP0123-20130129/8826_1 /TAXON_ID=182087 /ORGANISM="Favella ehrenbergii, Strain Fehren 1" /LENGTH=158 /DNA_ID=CAMNT_0010729423 /DNA_START=199 /DNA_END=672 /DNA_ORIENTATION=+